MAERNAPATAPAMRAMPRAWVLVYEHTSHRRGEVESTRAENAHRHQDTKDALMDHAAGIIVFGIGAARAPE